ncbi:hypothetical protein KJ640_02945 [bacterium]|nr:hypothetical protein [bacterium]
MKKVACPFFLHEELFPNEKPVRFDPALKAAAPKTIAEKDHGIYKTF